jgi:hypothetical protein
LFVINHHRLAIDWGRTLATLMVRHWSKAGTGAPWSGVP